VDRTDFLTERDNAVPVTASWAAQGPFGLGT
jgi:hypothetical protein